MVITKGRARAWVGACDGLLCANMAEQTNAFWVFDIANAPSRGESRARPGLKTGRYDAEDCYV